MRRDLGALARAGRELRRALLDLLLPPHCPGCGGADRVLAAATGLCAGCRAHLLPCPRPWCPRCGGPVLGAGCPSPHRSLAGLRFARAAFEYVGTGGALVRRLKFAAEFGAAAPLGRAMAAAVRDALVGGCRRPLVVPVPLHGRRRRQRGHDQAASLAEEVARRLGLEVCRALVRVRATRPQGDPRVGSRAANVDGAFAARRPRAVAGRVVLLVDDVTTSGATARACAAALRAAGARATGLVTACRARRPG